MRWIGYLEEGLIMLLMAAMTVITFMQVVARYVFNYSFVWALELTGVMFAWLIFVGMSYGVRVGSHIGVDALLRIVGPRTARAMSVVAALLCIAYALIVTWGGWHYVAKMKTVGILMQDLPIEQWIPRLVMPLGFALLALRRAQALWQLLRGQRQTLLVDEAKEALKLREDPAFKEGGA